MSDEANDTTTHLSDAEMQDLVVACVPAHDSEALYLITRLEDAGIPAAQINAGFRYPGTSPDLRVPRVLLNKAQETIAKARKDAQERSLKNAYDLEDVDEEELANDPVLMEMSTLMDVPLIEKRYLLIEKTIQWFSTGRSDAEIARYLSVAGLSMEESQDLVREIHTRHQAHFKQAQGHRHDIGIALIGFGGLSLCAGIFVLKGVQSQVANFVGFLAVFAGLAIIYAASRSPSQSALNPEKDQK